MKKCSMESANDVNTCGSEGAIEYLTPNASSPSHIKIESIKTEEEQCSQWIVVQDNNLPVSPMDDIKEEIVANIKSEKMELLNESNISSEVTGVAFNIIPHQWENIANICEHNELESQTKPIEVPAYKVAMASIPAAMSISSTWEESKPQPSALNGLDDEKTVKLIEVWKTDCELTFTCATCDKEFQDKTSALEHACVHADNEPCVCETCGEIFERIGEYFDHKKTHHIATKQNEDDQHPDENNSNYGKLKRSANSPEHQIMHTQENPYKCYICAKSFKRLTIMLHHQMTHTGEKPYKCTICAKSFRQAQYLQSHQITHIEEKPYKCTICAKSFKRSQEVKEHQITHTGEKPYKCTICAKRFKRSQELKQHEMTHTGEKCYKCTICTKVFTRSASLQRHQLTHTEEKPHKCTMCTKSFIRPLQLGRHKMTHKEKKHHKCTICTKVFTRSSSLKEHQWTHTEEKPYKCTMCTKSFIRPRQLQRHKMTHTEEKP